MSAELFEYINAVKPSLSDEKRAKLGLLLMHYITLARVSGGRVRMENILTASGKSFTHKVLGSMPLVRALAFGLKVDMTCKHDDSPIPEGLRRLCERCYIDIEACKSRHKKLENARSEMWDLVIFVRVALAVMAALHEDTLRNLDESYYGHRPVGYKPKSKWLGLGVEHATAPVRARDLARAKAPRPMGAATSRSTFGPARMTKKVSEKPSISSFGSSRSKSSSHKLPIMAYPTSTRSRAPVRQTRAWA
ncbi:hypothetical protein RSAG8_05640, partial [Rhizoctonia solani AG-8 WAC10335]